VPRPVPGRRRASWLAAALVCAAGPAFVCAASPAFAEPPALGERQQRLFQQACAHCHLVPGLGVPVVGDEAAWEERRQRGFESMLANTVNGVRNMPPLGTCGACTEDDLRRLVAFLAGLPRVPEPTAP
jgi:cytochrome c5